MFENIDQSVRPVFILNKWKAWNLIGDLYHTLIFLLPISLRTWEFILLTQLLEYPGFLSWIKVTHLKPNCYSYLWAPIMLPFSWTPKLKLESHTGHLPSPSVTHPMSNSLMMSIPKVSPGYHYFPFLLTVSHYSPAPHCFLFPSHPHKAF